MFGFGQKKSRANRVLNVRGKESGLSRLLSHLSNRSVLSRLGLVFAAVVLLLAAVQAWSASFPYRVGDYAPHGIAAKLDFERVDRVDTERARDAAAKRVPFIFGNHDERLISLPQQLRAALGEIALSEDLDELSERTRAAFGLLEPTEDEERPRGRPFAAPNRNDRYQSLKQAVSAGDMRTAETRIDDIVDDFSKFISPLRRYGVIDERDVRINEIERDSYIRVVSPGVTEEAHEVLLPQVRLIDQLSEAGDLGRSWLSYPSLKEPIRPALSHWLLVETPPTLQYDEAATKEAKAAARTRVPDVMDVYNAGDLLVRPGEVIDTTKLAILADEYRAAEQQITPLARTIRLIVVFVMVLVLAALNGYYILHNEPRLVRSLSRLSIYLAVIVVATGLGRALSYDPWRAEVIPLIGAVMVLSLAYNQVLATMTGFTLCLIITLSTTTALSQFVILMSTAAMAIVPLTRVASRSKLILVGVYTAATYFLVSLGMGVVAAQSLTEAFDDWTLLQQSAKGAAWCLAGSYLVAGSLPFIESTFGVVTDISLLEMSDPSHPLLQELVQRAPGTYNHSVTVGSIAETAAEAIGANGLLVRVGAYFHDIGKMLKPQYFIENLQTGTESRHAHLAPAMSTLIIIGHVKDGVHLAEQHNLPQALIDFIEQHHGTTLVEYFYHEAAKQAETQPDHRTDAEESSFRYPGPKPQSRETGVLMLSDAVESASRALTDPTPKRIETLVHNITMKRLLDGQFDESSLTLSEIRTIEASLVKSLIGIYHGRIRYPDARTA
ncbi:hypothetical protein Mal4_28080 [Maioricimonas rarisocia]|uniref:HD/PDEase domain-containing protein n=1 Tax=Maioricimonas rarisocia TaxID=2528026 RepID=A0A517Z7M0_9PLAN|nr:HDIG domain-containing metalloprotein [Maioricimonas rarisocia]QDU38480.1 hypothetical protein Mal4_28080 [Maioricimonas rarisocia]